MFSTHPAKYKTADRTGIGGKNWSVQSVCTKPENIRTDVVYSMQELLSSPGDTRLRSHQKGQ